MTEAKGWGRGRIPSPYSFLGLVVILASQVHRCLCVAEGKYGYFSRANNSQILLRQTTWNIRANGHLTEFSFRTCSREEEVELLYQKGTGSDMVQLKLQNGTLEFHWSVGNTRSYLTLGSNKYNNNEWLTFSSLNYLGNQFLNVSRGGRRLASVILYNSTYRTYFTSVDLTGSDGLYVGRNFTGCLMEGPNVIFINNLNVEWENVIWSNSSCPQSDVASCRVVTDVDDCYNLPCNNGGSCIDGVNTFSCKCPHLFNGTRCENDLRMYGCDVTPCLNNGTCTPITGGSNTYNCTCKPGFTGENCETEINECGLNPCKENATCTDLVDGFECNCTGTGYRGTLCEDDIDECTDNTICGEGRCFNNPGSFSCACPDGYLGPKCQDIDECVSSPCLNGGTCVDGENLYTCTCVTGYTGTNCETDINDCASVTCPHSNSQCVDLVNNYECSCLPGYTGIPPNCSDIDECAANPCQNGATCQNGENLYVCLCAPGYTDTNCSTDIDDCNPDPCLNDAMCIDAVNGFTCTCPSGFTGTTCATNIDECAQELNPCLNGGTCVDGIGDFTCHCDQRNLTIPNTNQNFLTGYEGNRCQNDIDECLITPSICLNNGTCKNTKGSFACSCISDSTENLVTGSFCEISTTYCTLDPVVVQDPPACWNNGTCQSLVGGFQCTCAPGFTDTRCKTDINECESNPCQYNGTCNDRVNGYVCDCIPGITGPNCETDIDECASIPCKYNGTCNDEINGYTCDCIPGITGSDCETDIDECASNPCMNGNCVDFINRFSCDCTDTGYTGELCDIEINECESNPCFHNATCSDYLKYYNCSCYLGYEGTNCEVDIDECASTPCHFNSPCFQRSNETLYDIDHPGFENLTFSYDVAAGFVCNCVAGSTGADCSTNIDDCNHNNCNNGTCKDLLNAYKCECFPGYNGTLCDTEINECELYSACQHGSICIDKIADYSCQCLPEFNGVIYGGKNCTFVLTACENNLCQNGATCQPYLISEASALQEYRCLCSVGFTGRYCNISTTMYFAGDGSYAMTSLTKLTDDESFSFRFRTTLRDAILVIWTGTHSSGLFMTIELMGGRIHMRYVSGSSSLQTALIQGKIFNSGDWVTVSVTKNRADITITVDSPQCSSQAECSLSVNYGTTSTQFKYFGNIPSSTSHTLTGTQYVGCMEDLTIDESRLALSIASINNDNKFENLIEGCVRNEQCFPDTCSGKGTCVDLWNQFRCDCYRPYLGTRCLSEHTAATFSFGNSSGSSGTFNMSLDLKNGLRTQMDLSFLFRTRQGNGLITFFGKLQPSFVTVELNSGYVASRIKFCGSEDYQLSSDNGYADGNKHLVRLYRNHTSISLYLAGQLQWSASVPSGCDFSANKLWFGGQIPSASGRRRRGTVEMTVQDVTDFTTTSNFKGTVQDVQLNDFSLQFYPLSDPSLTDQPSINMTSSSNLRSGEETDPTCDLISPCENNSTCSDVFFNDYSCTCLLGYRGKNCSELDFCVTGTCPAGSVCQSLLDGFECVSNATFDGKLTQVTYTNTLSNTTTVRTFSFVFRTLAMNGWILTIGNSSFYYKARLIGSNMVIVYKLGSGEEQSLSAPFDVSDSTWYLAKVTESDSMLNLTLHDPGEANMYVNVNSVRPSSGESLASLLRSSGEPVVIGNLGQYDSRNPFYQGCLREVRIGKILLPFFKDDEFVNNTSVERFLLQNSRGLTHGCEAGAGCAYSQCRSGSMCLADYYTYTCNCTDGFTGRWCEDRVDYCAQDTCVNGKCVSLNDGYSCACPAGYTGPRCQTDVNECAEGTPCQNGGTCVNQNGTFTCTCPSNFFGNFCEKGATELCDGSRCVFGTCNNVTDTNDQGNDVTTFNCTCDSGYYGYSCANLTWEYECSLVPCSNGGTCQQSPSPPYYTCNCATGYTGVTCDVNIDDCPVGACKNGGQCVDGLNTFACNCSSAIYWDGSDCTVDIDECTVNQPCQNEGLCLNHNYTGSQDSGYTCDCTAFYEGQNCEKDIDECERDVCKNGANCTNFIGDYDCNCTLGYTEKDCSVPDCDLINCLNNATCAVVGNQWQCQCLEFYEGEFCEIKGPCADRPCVEDNTLMCQQDIVANNYSCLCKTGWTGNICETDIDECKESDTCFNGGKCINLNGTFRCECPAEYKGERCADDVDECTTDNPCLNGGLCNNNVGGFTCNCSGTGYTNATCEDDVDECEDSPCLNGAGCQNTNGSYICMCLEDFEGRDCESKRVMEDDNIIWYIVGPCVAIVLILIVIGVVWFLMCMRKKRATRGAYSPSRQEVSGSRVELGNVLKKPPLERLI